MKARGRLTTQAWIAAVLAIGVGVAADGAAAASLSAAQLTSIDNQALKHWRASMAAHGLVGLQAESITCFKALAARPSQRKAAYCVALDHYSELDAMNFPDALQPPYFRTDPVFARADKAVALSTPAAERAAFESRVFSTLDEALHNAR